MPLRRPTDPFEAVLLSAGPASRRAERLTRGRMRPPADLAARAGEERRRQVKRFLRAVAATPAAPGTLATPWGPVQAEIHDSPVGFWVTGADGSVLPDPAGRAGFTAADLLRLVSSGDLELDATDSRTGALVHRISGAMGA